MSTTPPHPAEYVRDEMVKRGWNRDMLASLMCRTRAEYGVTRLALDFFLDINPIDLRLRMGDDMADQFALAFGTSAALFVNLERSWLASQKGAPR